MTLAHQLRPRVVALLRRAFNLCRILVSIFALIGLALALSVHVASLLHIDAESQWPHVWRLHGTVLIVFALAIISVLIQLGTSRPDFRDLIGLIPLPALALIALTLCYVAWTFVVYTPATETGVPIVGGGHFYLNDHGTVHELGEAEYHLERSKLLRIYSAFWSYLYLCALILLTTKRKPTLEHPG